MRRSRHLHLAGVSRKAVRAAVKTRQKVLQRENREDWCGLNGKHRLLRSKSCHAEGTSGSLEVKSAESGLKPEEDPSENSFFHWNTVEETTAHYS